MYIDAASALPMEAGQPEAPDVLGKLKTLLAGFRLHKDYSRIGDEFVDLSFALNHQGQLAPAFRPQPIVGLAKGHSIFIDIHRDQIVVDCHWLHCRHEQIVTHDAELQPLFDLDDEFQFDLAVEFANKNWTKKHRIGQLLVLTNRQQCQLATLRSKVIDGKLQAALMGVGKGAARIPPKVTAVRLKLNEWAERNKGVQRLLKDYENLWLARELLGDGAPVRQVAELFGLMSGKPKLDDKTVKGKLETLGKNIGGTT
jgi:hypothetical protein